MRTEQELENCLESFKRRCKIERNPETLKMWNVLRMYTEFILDRRGQMRYDDYRIESDLGIPGGV